MYAKHNSMIEYLLRITRFRNRLSQKRANKNHITLLPSILLPRTTPSRLFTKQLGKDSIPYNIE